MALLPNAFPELPETAIASYSFINVATGEGVLTLYGAVTNTGGTPDYILTPQAPYSNQIIVSGAIATGSATTQISNNNFDITFLKPIDIKGTAYLQIALGGFGAGGGVGTGSLFLSGATIANSTTSTTFATATSATVTIPATEHLSQNLLVPFDISAATQHLKAGDVLRLNLPLWCTASDAAAYNHCGYGADPVGRNDLLAGKNPCTLSGAAVTSQMILYIPTVIDI